MKKNILVLGGTRYFGKRLVNLLLERGHQVTLANRGMTEDSFGNRVERRTVDRMNADQVKKVAGEKKWDLVYDQICYSPDEALIACEAFDGFVKKYIHTSTASVYTMDGIRTEKHFDPYHYPVRAGSRSDFNYGEAKRLAEAVYFQKATFPVAAMRIPIVLGPDDYTGRLEFHIDRILKEQLIVVPNINAGTSLVNSSEAARFLVWLGENEFTGPINAQSDGEITIGDILKMIETHAKKKAVVASTGPEPDETPLTGPDPTILNTDLALQQGFSFDHLQNWLPQLIEQKTAEAFSKHS